MSSDDDAIRRVIQAFEKSDWTEIDVRVGSRRVHLRAEGAAAARPAPPAVVRTEQAPSAAATREVAVTVPADAIIVRSPSPGIFWRSPQPGAPPFADVDQRVDTNTTMCIVEVMKLMNHIKAGVSGKVVAVFGKDGVAVDKDEPLFAIDISTAAT